ncbi:HD domain-containing protein [Bacillaceae bacterium Marseille-Q3522]|nr:HD domain-containing protein [Bacillaceae bacterium Marseille-Q3522]
MNYITPFYKADRTGHDIEHIYRVMRYSKMVQEKEGGDSFLIQMGALLHDATDEKLVSSKAEAEEALMTYLREIGAKEEEIGKIMKIIASVSFKGGHGLPATTLEAQIVQDADRLDALGTLGIARTFFYAGIKGDKIYDPAIPIQKNKSLKEYRQATSTAINHFYEKLLLLKDLLNTKTAKELAESRQQVMLDFLKHFYQETGYPKPEL